MPSHDSSFVNTPLLLLPSAFPLHLCALSLWMTAWLQSPSSPQPNLPITVPPKPGLDNSYKTSQTSTISSANSRQDWSSHPAYKSTMCFQTHNTTLTEAVGYMGSQWAEIKQRRMLESHPLTIQGTDPSLFKFSLSVKFPLIMCQLTQYCMHMHTH